MSVNDSRPPKKSPQTQPGQVSSELITKYIRTAASIFAVPAAFGPARQPSFSLANRREAYCDGLNQRSTPIHRQIYTNRRIGCRGTDIASESSVPPTYAM